MDYILLIIGFVLLIKGADFFVDGSSSLAKLLKIPAVIIGLTIVAMGTSAPEAAVSITAVLLIIEQPLYIEYSGFLMSFGAIVAIGNLSEVFRLPEYKKVQLNLIKKADTNSISKKILIFKRI